MKISLKWLKDYVDLEGIPAPEIIDRLTNSGLEVEGVEDKGKDFENFVIGFVKEKRKHPNADKLSLCVVSDGLEDHNVVCGAPNVAAGQKVAFARVGAVIPNGGFKLTKAKIRGEVSMGMICSEKELGISDNHEGIMILDASLPEGKPLAEALGFDDIILEIGITPNRPDALSHFGVARDLSAIFNRKLKYPEFHLNEISEKIEDSASIEIIIVKDCPRYTAKVLKNVTVKESPLWLRQKLTSIGLRSINNIVDVTNYILHELGQPLHAFDLDKLDGNKIVVKSAQDGEVFTTLDSKERRLTSSDLMICDGEKAVAIAGVMGGENSEVTQQTKNILIESAYFNPSSVRKTAKSLGLSTDASYRFERGTDPDITTYAANRAAQIIADISGGEILSGILDAYPQKKAQKDVQLRFSRITKILGYHIPENDVKEILINLGFIILSENRDDITISVPAFRPDIEREIDLIEEVARIYGYDKIPTIAKISITLDEKTDQSQFKDILRDTAISLGFNEIITNSLIPEDAAKICGNPIAILNPLSSDMSVLRTSLLPGALFTVAKNINVGEKNLQLFELGNIFNKITNTEIKEFDDFAEEEKMCFILTGKAKETNWYSKERLFDFFDLKGYVNSFLRKFYLDNVLNDSYYHSANKFFDYGFSKNYKETVVGSGGSISKDVLKKFDINQDVYYFEFDILHLLNIEQNRSVFTDLLKYPKIVRDCAFILDKNISHDEVINTIRKGSTKLLKNVKLFDIFENEALGIEKKSMAFSLEYFDETRTLKDEEVDKAFYETIEKVKKELNAEFRGA